jgi:hypothetical protein
VALLLLRRPILLPLGARPAWRLLLLLLLLGRVVLLLPPAVAVPLLLALRSLPLVLSLLLILLRPSTGSTGGNGRGRLTSGTTADATAAATAAAAAGGTLVLGALPPCPSLLGPSAAANWVPMLLLRPAVALMVPFSLAARISEWLSPAMLLSSQLLLLLLVADLAVVDATTAAGVSGSAAD